MKISDIDGASKNNPAARRALTEIETWATALEKRLGVEAIPQPSVANKGRGIAPPPLCSFSVQGATGRFVISIVPPSGISGTLIHEIKTSSTLPFAASPDVTTYAPNPSTMIEIYEGNVTKFVQLRSKYYNSDFNEPQVISSSANAGTPGFHPLDPDYRFTNGGC